MSFDQYGNYNAGHNNKTLDVIMAGQIDGTENVDKLQDKIEKYASEGGRAYTITFTDILLNKYKDRYLMLQVEKMIKRTKNVLKYVFIKDLSATGRFHLHGVILAKRIEVYEIVRKKMSKNFGICKVKFVDNTQKWADYCGQQYTKEGKKDIVLKEDDLMYIKSE